MAIQYARLRAIRPTVYHVTNPENLAAIEAWRRLRAPANLLAGAADAGILHQRRHFGHVAVVGGLTVYIRDQRPLNPGEIGLEAGFTFDHLLQELNARVFFWAGRAHQPVDYGRSHIDHYSRLGRVMILRCSLDALVAANPGGELQVCRYNSGAPRRNPLTGRSPRGRSTFSSLADATFPACQVKEITYLQEAVLPPSTECADTLDGPWQPLWPVA